MDKYEDLRILEGLRSKGAISEEEYQREKDKILNSSFSGQTKNSLGMEENTYLNVDAPFSVCRVHYCRIGFCYTNCDVAR